LTGPGSPPSSGSRQDVWHAAGAIGAATLASRVLGLAREQVFAVFFGAGNLMDAFNLAFRVPNLLRNLFAEGALSAAIVPVFARIRQQRGEGAAWAFARRLFAVLGVSMVLAVAVGWVLAPFLVDALASAFREIPGKFELSVRMTRILFPFLPLVLLAAAFMGVLHACGVFLAPALAPALFNLVSISVGVALMLLARWWGPASPWQPIEGMALGVLAGGLAQALCQLPALYRAGYRSKRERSPQAPWTRDPELRGLMLLLVPGAVGLAAMQLSVLINTIAATRLGPGAVSHLSYAFRLMQFPIGLFGASLALAAQPWIARQWQERDLQGVTDTLTHALKQSLALNLPASAGLAFLSYPIVELIFQYGRFYPEDVRATAWALAMYSVGLTAYAVVKLLVPACYALGNARLPVLSSVASIVVAALLNLVAGRQFGVGGIALGTSLAALFNAAFLLVAVQKVLKRAGGDWPLGAVAICAAKHLLVSLSLGAFCYLVHQGLNSLMPDASWVALWGDSGWILARVLKVGIAIFVGVFWAAWIGPRFGARELSEPIDIFAKKLKNMLSRSKT
jgi:putative peptidoglycan lipid II flippase